MWQDLTKLVSDVGGIFDFSWGFAQWWLFGYFALMIFEFGLAIYQNKWPTARPSHIVFLIITVTSASVLFLSGFFK